MLELVLATFNKGKAAELTRYLGSFPVRLHTMDELRIPPVEETADTFEGNARLKAEAASRHTQHLVLADDSGLEVQALGGLPGVRSARYGGPGLDDEGRNRLLLHELTGTPWEERTARFVCVIAIARGGGMLASFRGTVSGIIALEPAGTHGFGYDPLFYYPAAGRTFGEMPAGEKERLSHRGLALQECAAWLRANA
jgi:XTP/dITP diphosphohydrolase